MKTKVRSGVLTRTLTPKECRWLEEDIPEGTLVFEYLGHTYGCIGEGVAVTRLPDTIPFTEVPRDAVEWDHE